ncbi:MAG: hypothetical protein AB8F65_00410 [Woeseiaceae bacterium]
MTSETDKQRLLKTLVMLLTIDFFAFIAVALAIYAKVVGPDNVFHPVLASEPIVNLMLGFGGATLAWCIFKIATISREFSKTSR